MHVTVICFVTAEWAAEEGGWCGLFIAVANFESHAPALSS
jgi:hypothetical protein